MQNARDDGAKSNARDDYARLKQAYQEEEAKLETLLAETSNLEVSEADDNRRLAELKSQQNEECAVTVEMRLFFFFYQP